MLLKVHVIFTMGLCALVASSLDSEAIIGIAIIQSIIVNYAIDQLGHRGGGVRIPRTHSPHWRIDNRTIDCSPSPPC